MAALKECDLQRQASQWLPRPGFLSLLRYSSSLSRTGMRRRNLQKRHKLVCGGVLSGMQTTSKCGSLGGHHSQLVSLGYGSSSSLYCVPFRHAQERYKCYRAASIECPGSNVCWQQSIVSQLQLSCTTVWTVKIEGTSCIEVRISSPFSSGKITLSCMQCGSCQVVAK